MRQILLSTIGVLCFFTKSNSQTIFLQNSPGNPTATTVATPTSSNIFILEFKVQNNDTTKFFPTTISTQLCCGAQSFISRMYLTDTANVIKDSINFPTLNQTFSITDSINAGSYKKYRIKVRLNGVVINQFFGVNVTSVAGLLNGTNSTVTNTVLGNQFLTSGPTCAFTLSQNTAVVNQNIGINTTDTIGSFKLVTGPCGGTLTSFSFTKTGTSADSNYTNIKLYKGVTQVGSMLWNLSSVNTFITSLGLPGNDTSIFTLIATVDPNATISETIQGHAYGVVTDSVYSLNTVLPTSAGQTMTTSGCILQASKNTGYPNTTVTPTTNVKIGSFNVTPVGGCAVNVQFISLTNIGNVTNSYITNVLIKKGANQLGSTVPTMGASAIFTFNDLNTSMATYDVYADISTSAINADSIKLTFNATGVNVSTSTLVWTQNATGQTTTINNPVIYSLIVAQDNSLSNQIVNAGTSNVLIGKFKVKSTGANTALNIVQIPISGTSSISNLSNLIVKSNGVTLSTTATPSTNMFIPINDTLQNGVIKVYEIFATINSAAVNLSTIVPSLGFSSINLSTMTPSAYIPQTGQTTTINNPSTPCILNAVEFPTTNTLPRGSRVCLGKITTVTGSCNMTLTSLKVDVFGTGLTADNTNVVVEKNGVPVSGTDPIMNFTNTYALAGQLNANQVDTLSIWADLSPTATIGDTYELSLTLNVFDGTTTQTVQKTLATKTITAGFPTTLNDVEKEKISIHPNPSHDFITVQGLEDTDIQVFSTLGEKISVSFLHNTACISNLPNGIYFLKAKTYSGRFIKK